MVKLSVCVVTYNRAALLDKTLQSLSEQTRQPDELIISDDCSPDNTTEVVTKWKKHFSNFRYNRNPKNLYMPGNLNVAVGQATGEYIANLHDADVFDPTLLEKWESTLDTYPSAGFVFCGIRGWLHKTEFGDGIILHDVQPLTSGSLFFEKFFLHKFSSIVWGTVMARRAAYQKLLPFDSKYGPYSDVDMWMRMCMNYDIAYIREPLILLDNSPTPWRKFNWQRVETVRQMQIDNIKRYYTGNPDRLKVEIVRHHKALLKMYFRRIVGRIWHRDFEGALKGISLLFKIKKSV